jgi:hypothetical protein
VNPFCFFLSSLLSEGRKIDLIDLSFFLCLVILYFIALDFPISVFPVSVFPTPVFPTPEYRPKRRADLPVPGGNGKIPRSFFTSGFRLRSLPGRRIISLHLCFLRERSVPREKIKQ